WEQWAEAHCRAELEQAHGRLRTIHRQSPGRALHIGMVLPGGPKWGARQVEVRSNQGGRPTQSAPNAHAELRAIAAELGGVRATAHYLDCAPSQVRQWLNGDRPIPLTRLGTLRCLARARRGRWPWAWRDQPFVGSTTTWGAQ